MDIKTAQERQKWEEWFSSFEPFTAFSIASIFVAEIRAFDEHVPITSSHVKKAVVMKTNPAFENMFNVGGFRSSPLPREIWIEPALHNTWCDELILKGVVSGFWARLNTKSGPKPFWILSKLLRNRVQGTLIDLSPLFPKLPRDIFRTIPEGLLS